jgi:hypothetical protein
MGSAVERIPPTAAIRQRIRVSWIFLFLRLLQISFFIFNKSHWPLLRAALSNIMYRLILIAAQ